MRSSEPPRGPLAWFAQNHVTANLLMIFLLVTGVLSMRSIKMEVFPEIDPDIITVTVPYPGASPAEAEESICQRVEEAIKGIEGIKRVRSVAYENLGVVTAELEDYADDREVLDDVKAAVDMIEDFPPKDAEEHNVVDVESRVQVISIVLYGDVPERTLKELADDVRDDLTAMENISLVETAGVRKYEISIEVSEEILRRHELSFTQVADIVRRSSLDLPGGSVKTEGGEILIRTKGQRYVGQDFEDIVLLTRPDGTKLYLSEVASIVDGFEDSDTASFFDGKPAVILKVFCIGDQGALDIEKSVLEYIENKEFPEGVKVSTWFNRATYLRSRLELLTRNGLIGLVLVFLCLLLFLDVRLAFWTTMGIPISFLGSFCLMPLLGISINMISLFALIVVLGLVVDDAIVVGENIFAYRQRGMKSLEAAVKGVREMAFPVTIAILTTVVAFLPLLHTKGRMGKVLWPIPVVVTCVLMISLAEALLILPAHLSSIRMGRRLGPFGRFQNLFRDGLRWFIDKAYAALLKRAVAWRYLTVAVGLAILGLTLGVVLGGYVKFKFMPEVDADNMWAVLSMPKGTPIEQTRRVVERLENAVEIVRGEFDEKLGLNSPSIIRHISSTVGQQPFEQLRSGGPGAVSLDISSSHLAEVNVELLSSEERSIPSNAIAQRWREIVGEVPGVSSLTFMSRFFSTGEAINVELSHQDFDTLLAATEGLKKRLAGFKGVSDIADSFEPGKIELKLSLTDLGRTSGLTLSELARQVRQGFYGEEVQRVQRGRDDIKVMVRYPEAQRRSLGDVHNMRIRLPDGTEVPFGLVAHVREGREYSEINRSDRRRVVNVTADVNDQVANANEINEKLHSGVLPNLKREIPGLHYSFEGEQREQAESLESLKANMIVGLLAIFVLLALQFRSYIQPLIVMLAIPFGITGAVLGHVIMGLDLSILSSFGVVALGGVVVNDSLIMLDLINRERKSGIPLRDVIIHSGTRRFRPILLTTATTFLGLTPLILERSLQARFLIPMAVSLGFGVVFATMITLLIIPALYMILEDVKGVIR